MSLAGCLKTGVGFGEKVCASAVVFIALAGCSTTSYVEQVTPPGTVPPPPKLTPILAKSHVIEPGTKYAVEPGSKLKDPNSMKAGAGVLGVGSVGQRWAVIIGISRYKFSGQAGFGDLAFADNDAKQFAATLKERGYDDAHMKVLINEQASKQQIQHALETWLRRVDPNDVIVLFWASHGWPDPGESDKAYFACYESKPSDPSSGLRMDWVRQMLEERRTRNVVVIADTCHAGKVIRGSDPNRGMSVVPALDSMEHKGQIPRGWVFIASADPDRKAYEDKAWNNGALTYVLLEGLRQHKADGYKSAGKKDGMVTLGELRAYITDRMGEETLNVTGAKLTPFFYTTSGYPEIWNLEIVPK